MSVHAAMGLAVDDAGVDSFAEAAARAALQLGGRGCDLAVVFAGGAAGAHGAEGVRAVCERLRPRALIGCAAQGVVGGGREVEEGGVAVWAASLPDAEVEPLRLEAAPAEGGMALTGLPDLDGADAALLLVDPYSFPAEGVLAHLSDEHPGLPVIGGMASGSPGTAMLIDGEAVEGGAVGVALRGVDVVPLVSQGARPIGPEMTVTAGEGNVIAELASKPAIERLREVVTELEADEAELVSQGLLLGVVVDRNKPEYERGDFLIRGITGVDQESGALAVATRVEVGQTVRLQVRDAASAHEDLVETLGRGLEPLAAPPAGALLFTCNGRGSRMFGTPDHDARAVMEALSGAPTGGFFCAGEIGPVGGRSFLHGFTATVAVFAG
jgi:small ligand-binding sensory domain FIST